MNPIARVVVPIFLMFFFSEEGLSSGSYVPFRDGETAEHYARRQQAAIDAENHRREMQRLNQAQMENARGLFGTTRAFLNKNIVTWYSAFFGLGCGALLSNAFGGVPPDDPLATTLCVVGGTVAGSIGGCLLKRFRIFSDAQCGRNCCTRLGWGLVSWIPLAVFGVVNWPRD